MVPSCWGMSLTMLREGLTFTVVATDQTTAGLDALQFLQDGPCEEAVRDGTVVRTDDVEDLFDEERWREFASHGAAAGVRSTLSLPVKAADEIIGGFNFYAGRPHAFDDAVEVVAGLVGAWAPGAVRNADMAFESRDRARNGPDRLAELGALDRASGYLAAVRRIPVRQARADLLQAAERANVSPRALAELLLEGKR